MEKVSFENIEFMATVYGWVKIYASDMMSFKRKGARMNIWFDKWGTMTVGTALEHPKQGKTQLFRRRVNMLLLEAIFENPRIHTNRGYQRKS